MPLLYNVAPEGKHAGAMPLFAYITMSIPLQPISQNTSGSQKVRFSLFYLEYKTGYRK
jgi:hypothetical protein